MKSGKGFVGVLAMSQDQIMQVMLVAFVTKYAGASMSSISSLASMLSQLPAFVYRVHSAREHSERLHREHSAATLINPFSFGYSLNEYKLKARNNFQFKAYITNHAVLCLIL